MADVSDGLPDVSDLRAMELESRQQGSGLRDDELIGLWRVERIWGKRGDEPVRLAGAALRSLTASLRIRASANARLSLTNSIAIGALRLCFSGPAELRTRRPLLVFHFEQVRLTWADHVLWSRPLPAPAAGREPFFALIARGASRPGSHWLAARGRGGGLALWVREENGPV